MLAVAQTATSPVLEDDGVINPAQLVPDPTLSELPEHVLWGERTAQSQRHFAIGSQRMPAELVRALAWLSWADAGVKAEMGLLAPVRARRRTKAAERVADGAFDDEFPLSVWQSGSGHETLDNFDEVMTQLGRPSLRNPPQLVGAEPLPEPDDHASSHDDAFLVAVHLAVALQAKARLIPAHRQLRNVLAMQAIRRFNTAAPADPQERQERQVRQTSWVRELGRCDARLASCGTGFDQALAAVYALPLASGLSSGPASFQARVASRLSARLALPLVCADDSLVALAGREALVALHGQLAMLAIELARLGRRVTGMSSQTSTPRCGPAQSQSLAMICAQVVGHQAAISFAASQSEPEQDTFKPLLALNILDSQRLLADSMHSFARHGFED